MSEINESNVTDGVKGVERVLNHQKKEFLDDGILTMRKAAEKLRHSYYWLSRNYRKLRLHPISIGYPILFDEKEIDGCLRRRRITYRGRPRKTPVIEQQRSDVASESRENQ